MSGFIQFLVTAGLIILAVVVVAQTAIKILKEYERGVIFRLGRLPGSGLALRGGYERFDAAKRFGLSLKNGHEAPGCLCGEVIKGKCAPTECPLFGAACTPSEAEQPSTARTMPRTPRPKPTTTGTRWRR